MRIMCVGVWFFDYTIQLANALSKKDVVRLMILANKSPGELLDIIDKKVDFHLLAKGKPVYHPASLLLYKNVVDKVSEFKPDVIHWQVGGSLAELALVPCFRKYPLVSTFHDVSSHIGEERWLADFVRCCVRKSSDEVIVHGEKLRREMMRKYNIPGERVHAIHIGEHEVAPFKKYEKDDIKEDGNLILFFGRIWEYKGLEYLIKAEPIITEEVSAAKIVIAGTGENFKKYEKMIGNRRENFIIHNYRIPYEEGAELFQRSSVVVLPYIDASQSGVVPTAYGFKKPVVVTDVGSIPEIVDNGKTGFVIPPRDSRALAEAIIKLLKDEKLRKEMGENAYKKLKEDFSWDRIAERTIEVYKKAMDDAKGK